MTPAEQAAKEYADNQTDVQPYHKGLRLAFLAGAAWQREESKPKPASHPCRCSKCDHLFESTEYPSPCPKCRHVWT